MEESNDSALSPCTNSNDSSVTTYLTAGNDDDSLTNYTDCSVGSGIGIISDKIIEEERMLAEEAAREEEKLQRELEERIKKEEKEQRYKRLMHLLNKSQFYSSYLFQKLERGSSDDQEKGAKRGRKPKGQLDSKENLKALTEKNSNVITSSDSNEKNHDAKLDNHNKGNIGMPKTPGRSSVRKRKANALYYNDTYNIKDVISKEEIENVKRVHLESNNDSNIINNDGLNDVENKNKNSCNDENNPDDGKTKITGLGFTVSINQPDLLEGGVLRDYQMQGIEWLKLIYENGLNGILADEMGLGKTIQVIGLICFLIEKGIKGPYLIVAPLSTLSNWILEFEKFAPQVPVVLFHGTQQERRNLHKALFKSYQVGEFVTKPVVVTSYEVPLKESPILSSRTWDYIIVDEGHRIKNANSYLSRVLRSIRSNNRLLLTGTPLQNNLTELWSLLNFLLPELFDDLSTFEAWFDVQEMDKAESAEKIIQQEREQKVISILHQILFPFLLRRTKTDIVLDIPPKKEVMVFCPMTQVQMELYEVIVDKSIAGCLNEPEHVYTKRKTSSIYRRDSNNEEESLNSSLEFKTNEYFPLNKMPACKALTKKLGDKVDGRPGFIERLHMQNPPMILKHIVNHPYLVRMPVRYKNSDTKILHVTEDLKNVSGKLLVLDAMLAKLKEKGHKVLIFCTSAMMLDLLEEYVIMARYSYVRLDGGTKLLDRKNDIYAFNTNPDVFVFLLTTRAGGLGINLTGADTVILYDSDWNPQVDLQAQDRVHRIGQTKPVVVYRFNVAGTIDEKVITRASSKRKLEKIVMRSGAFNLRKQKKELFDLQELKELLQTTDAQKQMHSNGFIFSDEELEELLDRSDLIMEYKNRNIVSSEPNINDVEKDDGYEDDENDGDRKNDDVDKKRNSKNKVYEVLKVEK